MNHPAHLLRLFTQAPKAFWRFDIDFSLDAAVRMAEFAQTAGIQGRFYVMATSSFYNPFSLPGIRALHQIKAHGHRLGMHVDERYGNETPGDLSPAFTAVIRATELFEAIPGPRLVEPSLVSFHMPTPAVLWRNFVAFDNAYAREWEGRYLSDARREWGPDKEALVTNTTQINLHPEHWFGWDSP